MSTNATQAMQIRTKTPAPTLYPGAVSSVLMDSFVDNATPTDLADVREALPKVFQSVAEMSIRDGKSYEIRVGKTLSAGTRRTAIRVFTFGEPKPVFSTSPSVILGRRRPRSLTK